MKRLMLLVLLAVVVVAGLWLTAELLAGTGYPLFGMDPGAPQPIAYPHAKHIALGIECQACHAGVTQGREAGIPPTHFCKVCHLPQKNLGPPGRTDPAQAAALAASEPAAPTSEKLRGYLEKDEEIPWIQHQRVPRHVLFSHRRHFVIGKLECTECHDDMEHRTEPADRAAFPMRLYGMNRCSACHLENEVTTDCLACHR